MALSSSSDLNLAPPMGKSTPTAFQTLKDKVNTLLNNDNVRWVILFLAVVISYVYLFMSASSTPVFSPSEPIPPEKLEATQTALFLYPSRGGYNVRRGDPSSPSLFRWDVWEVILLIMVVILSGVLFKKFVLENEPKTPWYVRGIQFLMAWTNSVILLFFLPMNDFHRRMLYNLRAVGVAICNDAMKELWMAFLFIVVLPLPGSQSPTDRMSWMALKLGVFYIGQNILLGSPNYALEPYTENKTIPETGKELVGYGLLFLVVFIIYFSEHFGTWKSKAWDVLTPDQKNTRAMASTVIGLIFVGLIVLAELTRKSIVIPPSPSPSS
jgi:hypothetical protein